MCVLSEEGCKIKASPNERPDSSISSLLLFASFFFPLFLSFGTFSDLRIALPLFFFFSFYIFNVTSVFATLCRSSHWRHCGCNILICFFCCPVFEGYCSLHPPNPIFIVCQYQLILKLVVFIYPNSLQVSLSHPNALASFKSLVILWLSEFSSALYFIILFCPCFIALATNCGPFLYILCIKHKVESQLFLRQKSVKTFFIVKNIYYVNLYYFMIFIAKDFENVLMSEYNKISILNEIRMTRRKYIC